MLNHVDNLSLFFRKLVICSLMSNACKWPSMTTKDFDASQQNTHLAQTDRVTPSSGGASPPKNGSGGSFRDGRLLNQPLPAPSEGAATCDDDGALTGSTFCLMMGRPHPAAGHTGQLLSTGARHQGQKPQRDNSIIVEPLLPITSTFFFLHSSDGGICRVPNSDAADACDTTGAAS